MNSTDIAIGSLITGPLISWIVSGLKRISLVKRHPRVATAVLSTIIPAGIAIYGQATGVEVASAQQLATAMATQFAAAITTHETVTHEINKIAEK